MKTKHSYRYYFKNQSLIWCSERLALDTLDAIRDALYSDDSLNWALTVIAVSVGHPTHLKKRLTSLNGDHFWIEQNVIPLFEGKRICGFEGRIVLS